jgi:lipid-A-disaccharide synthase
MLVILPFEAAFYEQHGVRATYVGNPLADASGVNLSGTKDSSSSEKSPSGTNGSHLKDFPGLRAALGLDPSRPVLALLPGSRRQEIRRLWPPLLGAARLLRARRPELQLVVPVAPTIDRALLDPGDLQDVTFIDGRAPEVLRAADVAVVASGTATLEAALAQVPLVVVYRLSWLSWLIGRLLVRVRFVSLVNLLAGRRLVPELLQRDCTREAIADEASRLLERGAPRDEQLAGMQKIHDELLPAGAPQAARRAAAEVLALLDAGAAPGADGAAAPGARLPDTP